MATDNLPILTNGIRSTRERSSWVVHARDQVTESSKPQYAYAIADTQPITHNQPKAIWLLGMIFTALYVLVYDGLVAMVERLDIWLWVNIH